MRETSNFFAGLRPTTQNGISAWNCEPYQMPIGGKITGTRKEPSMNGEIAKLLFEYVYLFP